MLFFRSIDRNDDGFIPEDFEYLERKVLTTRSLMSEKGLNSMRISKLCESAKTILQTITYLTDEINVVSVEINISESEYTKITWEGYVTIPSEFVRVEQQFRPLDRDGTDSDEPFEFYRKIHLWDENTHTWNTIQEKSREANRNGIVSYGENYPMPSLYIREFIETVRNAVNTEA